MDLTHELRTALLRARLKPEDVEPYCERVKADYEQLTPHLPENITSLLDIGCGWGGHALYLAKHYGPDTQMSLIEGTKTTPKKQSGFRETSEPYRNGTIAIRLLGENDVHAKLYPVNERTGKLRIPSDLIVSFCAWGHHFPIATYLPLVLRSLTSGGYALVDIRVGTDGTQELVRAGFIPMKAVKSKPKFERILFVRPV